MSYIAVFDTRVCRIPAKVGILSFNKVPAFRGNSMVCFSDLDYYGYTEAEFEILDRKGRKAEWLERKMTEHDYDKAEAEVVDYMENKYDPY